MSIYQNPSRGSGSDEDIVETLGPRCDGDVSGMLVAAADTTTEIPVSIGSRSESESAVERASLQMGHGRMAGGLAGVKSAAGDRRGSATAR